MPSPDILPFPMLHLDRQVVVNILFDHIFFLKPINLVSTSKYIVNLYKPFTTTFMFSAFYSPSSALETRAWFWIALSGALSVLFKAF